MKKILFFAAIAACMGVMTSCSQDDELSSPSGIDNNTIVFATSPAKATRSAVTINSISQFTVSAVNNDNQSYFSNEAYTYNAGSSVFTSQTPHYWPLNASLNFFAISDPGVASVDANNAPLYTFNDWEGETDLVAATVRSGAKEIPYPLTFQHVTSQIYVSAEASDKTEELTYKLISVKMTTPSTGTYSFDASTGGYGFWEIDNTKTSQYSYNDALPMSFNQDGQIKLNDCYWNILPVKDGTISFSIEYQVYQHGMLIADFTGANAKACEAENPNLSAGKRYVYNFMLSRGTDSEITFTATISDWNEGNSSDKTFNTVYSDYVFPSDGQENGFDYIDLGVKNSDGKAVLFATSNVGADHAMKLGNYYQWADSESCGEEPQEWGTYKFSPTLTGTATSGYGESVYTKYSSTDNITEVEPEDDAVHINMGGDWRLPSHEEWSLMMEQTNVERTTIGGVFGLKVSSKTDSSKYIFLPAAGLVIDTGLSYVNDRVRYWSSTLAANKRFAYYLGASSTVAPSANNWMTIRCFGMNLRGIVIK